MIPISDAKSMHNFITSLRQRYSAAGLPLQLPRRPYVPSKNTHVRFSSLGMCPLKAGFDKNRVEAPLKAMLPENNPYTLHVMERGTYTQDMFQEPLMWFAQENPDVFKCEVEKEIIYEHKATDGSDEIEFTARGYADAVIEFLGQDKRWHKAVIEIKDSEGSGGKIGTPRKNYAMQTIGYAETIGATFMFILINSKRGFHIYEICRVNNGYMVYDRFNDVFHPYYGDKWNDPALLTWDAIVDEMRTVNDYMQAVASWDAFQKETNVSVSLEDFNIEVPIEDPFDDRSIGWQCVSVLQKKKEYKTKDDVPGVAQANCPFASHCHGYDENKFTLE